MSSEHNHPFVRDDKETEITVFYVIESYGYPSNGWDDAGEGPELYIERAELLGTGEVIELTDAERSRIESDISENPEWWEPDDGPDPDDARDAEIDRRLCEGG